MALKMRVPSLPFGVPNCGSSPLIAVDALRIRTAEAVKTTSFSIDCSERFTVHLLSIYDGRRKVPP
jgi:hypothetical protein